MTICANKNCEKEVTHKKGHRKRITCSNSCRTQYFQQRRAEIQASKFVTVPKEEWEMLQRMKEANDGLGEAFFNDKN